MLSHFFAIPASSKEKSRTARRPSLPKQALPIGLVSSHDTLGLQPRLGLQCQLRSSYQGGTGSVRGSVPSHFFCHSRADRRKKSDGTEAVPPPYSCRSASTGFSEAAL